ncbi:hypothetical protein GTY57_20970 [Streptomyces sp. SID5475]|nr:hypothetical protein [Streptomyces sp. SID5475]
MIEPSGIPQFTGDFEQLDKDVSRGRSPCAVRTGGGHARSGDRARAAPPDRAGHHSCPG